MPLPSAEYARSKLPSKEETDAKIAAEEKKEEDEAREAIERAYKEGMNKFIVTSVRMPKSVINEMIALGWCVHISDALCTHEFSLD